MVSKDSFGARGSFEVGGTDYEIFRISAVPGFQQLPFTHKVLLENLLRTEDGANVTADQIRALGAWDPAARPTDEIQFTPIEFIGLTEDEARDLHRRRDTEWLRS